MDFASSLEIRQTRSLAMTAQLRQAIGLLRLTNAELAMFIRREIRQNPFLEFRTDRPPAEAGDRGEHTAPLPPSGGAGTADGRALDDMLPAKPEGLLDHVAGQIRLSVPAQDRHIAFAFANALEPWGWLGTTVEDVAVECGCTVSKAEEVLSLLQSFEPAGLFARSLRECLRLQAQDQDLLDPVMATMLDRLDLLADGQLGELAALCGCPPEAVAARAALLRRFDPKPGARFAGAEEPLRAPDLILNRAGDSWTVELNASTLPEIRVREDRVADADKRDAFVAEALANARGLKRAIEQRNANTLAVAAEVVRRQEAFLNDPEAPLAPMSMREVAAAVSLHESTVSRVSAGLTLQTERGMLDMRALFARGLPSLHGDAALPVPEVHGRIARIIRTEPDGRPISDEKIAARLRGEGVSIQRRTVAKYRDALGIPGSAARRRAAGTRRSER